MAKPGRNLVFSVQLVALLVSPGCACPHRKAETSHALEWFDPAQRVDGLICRESWKDSEGGGGFFLLADPTVQNMVAIHTNQAALGGGSSLVTGQMTIVVDSNSAPIIGAAGTAVGNVIGATVKSSIK